MQIAVRFAAHTGRPKRQIKGQGFETLTVAPRNRCLSQDKTSHRRGQLYVGTPVKRACPPDAVPSSRPTGQIPDRLSGFVRIRSLEIRGSIARSSNIKRLFGVCRGTCICPPSPSESEFTFQSARKSLFCAGAGPVGGSRPVPCRWRCRRVSSRSRAILAVEMMFGA